MSVSYRDQLLIINDIRVKEGHEHRGNCPFCGGRNSFTLTKKQGSLIWNCFKASCGIRGSKSGLPSTNALRMALEGRTEPLKTFPPLPHLVPIKGRPEPLEWLSSYHALEAYETGLAKVMYSPEYDRVCFQSWNPRKYFLHDHEDMEGWIGRVIPTYDKYGNMLPSFPKWMKWGDTNHVMEVGNGRVGIVVEDPLSAMACGVVEGYTGCSLLGTNLTRQHITELKKYDELLFCLDPDAYDKGLKMSIKLSGTVNTRMVPIENDLKYYDKDEIRRMIE